MGSYAKLMTNFSHHLRLDKKIISLIYIFFSSGGVDMRFSLSMNTVDSVTFKVFKFKRKDISTAL